jgi:hypothetical protein
VSDIELTLEQALKLCSKESAPRDIRIIGALSAARILIGDEPLRDSETARVIIDLIESIGGAL